jgi:amino-acid N-acetyltransferase
MKRKEVEIRPATAADIAGIAQLIAPFVHTKKLLPRTEEELNDLTRNGFVAISVDEIVGFAAIDVYSRKLAELVCLAVTDDRQREGIGKKLVQHCVDRARELKVLELLAISASDAFLKECGFDYSLPDQKRALFYQPLRENTQVEKTE